MADRTRVSLGIVPLTDAALPVIAAHRGFAAEEGLDLRLSVEFSWASIRDKLSFGLLDCAQLLAGIPLAADIGAGQLRTAMIAPFSLGLNGNAITVSEALYQEMAVAHGGPVAAAGLDGPRALKAVIDGRRARGEPGLVFATVFAFSSHNYELRYWMATAGIDPDRDVTIVVVPPPKMPETLEEGRIDGYCVGEPWNVAAAVRGIGRIVATKYGIWHNSPEKVLGMRREWAEENGTTVAALIRALHRAGLWADDPANRAEIADLLVEAGVLELPAEIVRLPLLGTVPLGGGAETSLPDYNVFNRYAANFPWRSHALWFLSQMVRWGQIGRDVDLPRVAARVYRPDIYRAALAGTGTAVPSIDSKPEGRNDGPYSIADGPGDIVMGADRFVDGLVFDPDRIAAYLDGFAIRHPRG